FRSTEPPGAKVCFQSGGKRFRPLGNWTRRRPFGKWVELGHSLETIASENGTSSIEGSSRRDWMVSFGSCFRPCYAVVLSIQVEISKNFPKKWVWTNPLSSGCLVVWGLTHWLNFSYFWGNERHSQFVVFSLLCSIGVCLDSAGSFYFFASFGID